MLVHLILNLSDKRHLYCSCFGWVQKWLKFEFNSNLNYFYAFKNVQTNLFKYFINPGLHIYLYLCEFPSQNPWPFQSWRCLIILGRIKEGKEGLNPIRSPAGPFFPRPSRAERPPAPSLTASPSSRVQQQQRREQEAHGRRGHRLPAPL